MENNLKNDGRFAHVATDPRFRRVPKSERKVKIDKRFQSMFSDDNFTLKCALDKRGRSAPITKTEELRRYYDLSSGESELSDSEDGEDSEDSEDSESEKEEDEKEDEEKAHGESINEEDEKEDEEKVHGESSKEGNTEATSKPNGDLVEEELHSAVEEKVPLSEEIKEKLRSNKIDYARGNGLLLSDSSSDEESSENESEADIREMDHDWGELDRDAERTEEVTHRLAVCNMDWDRIRASDLMVLFNSFMPPGSVICSVTIYPSEFGLEQMKKDEFTGPAELLADQPTEPDKFDREGLPPKTDNEDGDKFNMERLRQYQLKRLKYYYAVIKFDSPETANKIYTECDGIEYESSSARLDLRFVPDDTTFDQEPKESCDQMPDPSKYTPLKFTTSALHQGKVQLTWDEINPFRVEVSKRIAAGTADEADFRSYLASSSEEEDEEEYEKESTMEVKAPKPAAEASINKYRALLSGIEEEEKKKDSEKVSLQVTWGLDLKKKASKLVNQKILVGPEGPTPFQEMMQKKKEKHRKKWEAHRLKNGSKEPEDQDEPLISDDDIPFDVDMNDPFFNEENQGEEKTEREIRKERRKELRKERKKEMIKKLAEEDTEESKQRKAELELLLMESEDERQHFCLKQIMESEKATTSKKKKMKKKKKMAKPVMEDDFKFDMKDERFSALFSSHHFSIDPTDAKYRKTNVMESLVAEKIKRRLVEEEVEPKQDNQDSQAPSKKAKKSAKMDPELSHLVATLKKKASGKFNS